MKPCQAYDTIQRKNKQKTKKIIGLYAEKSADVICTIKKAVPFSEVSVQGTAFVFSLCCRMHYFSILHFTFLSLMKVINCFAESFALSISDASIAAENFSNSARILLSTFASALSGSE